MSDERSYIDLPSDDEGKATNHRLQEELMRTMYSDYDSFEFDEFLERFEKDNMLPKEEEIVHNSYDGATLRGNVIDIEQIRSDEDGTSASGMENEWEYHEESIDILIEMAKEALSEPKKRPIAFTRMGAYVSSVKLDRYLLRLSRIHNCILRYTPIEYCSSVGPRHEGRRDNMTAAEIRQRDSDREDIIRQYCDLDIVWECSIASLRRIIPSLDDHLKCNKAPGPVIAAEALFGGRTEPIRLVADTHFKPWMMLKYKDFTSLYPWCMKYGAYPVGASRRMSSHELAELVSAQPAQLESIVKGIVSCSALHWDTWKVYTKQNDLVDHGIFSEYVDTFLKLKQEASGYPEGVVTEVEKDEYIRTYYENEGILLTKENIRKDEVLRQVAKLLLNSLWGKFGERTDRPQVRILGKKGALYTVMEDPSIEIRSVLIVGAKLLVTTIKLADCVEPLITSAMPYAVFTTSHARVHLYRTLALIPEPEKNILYMDTDSVIYSCPVNADPLTCGDYLGELTDELKASSTLRSFVTVGPKSYSFMEEKDDGTTKVHLKIKGFPKTSESERLITMQLMERQVHQLLKGEPTDTVNVLYKQIVRDSHHRVLNRDMVKKFQFTFTKRTVLPDGGTLPIGTC